MSKEVEEYEKCPLCFHGRGGKGKRYSEYPKGSLLRKYFKCDKCGHTWSQDFTPEKPIVQNHEINLETRLPNRQKPSLKRKKS